VLTPPVPFSKPPPTAIAVIYLFSVSPSPLRALKSSPHLAGMPLDVFPHQMLLCFQFGPVRFGPMVNSSLC
jgi:hypothetical protein